MEEAVTEDAVDAEEPSEVGRSLEETIEKRDPAKDRRSYKPELSNSDGYKPIRRHSKKELNLQNKESSGSREGMLESLIESDEDISFTIDEDGERVPTYKGRIVYGEGSSMPARLIGKAVNESKAREINDSFDGAHVIIYHRDPQTGKLYFAFEIKPADYPISKYAGRASLYGGSLKIGEPPNEGLSRELKEEDPDSYKVLIKALNETRWKFAEITAHIDGVPSTTYIWAAEIKDPMDWSKYESTRSIEGDKAIKSLEEVLGMKSSDFAFGFGPIVIGAANVLGKNYAESIMNSANFNLNNRFTPHIYYDGIIPQHFALSMELLLPKESRQYKPAILSFHNLN